MSIKSAILGIPIAGYLCRLVLDSLRLPVFRNQTVESMRGLTVEIAKLQVAHHAHTVELASLRCASEAPHWTALQNAIEQLRTAHSELYSQLLQLRSQVDATTEKLREHSSGTGVDHESLNNQLDYLSAHVIVSLEKLTIIEQSLRQLK